MHHVSAHLASKIAAYGDMDLYNIQGLEKLNDLTTTLYFRGTNRKHDVLSQMMHKRIRIETYILDSIRRPESRRVIEAKLNKIEYFQKNDLYDIIGMHFIKNFSNWIAKIVNHYFWIFIFKATHEKREAIDRQEIEVETIDEKESKLKILTNFICKKIYYFVSFIKYCNTFKSKRQGQSSW